MSYVQKRKKVAINKNAPINKEVVPADNSQLQQFEYQFSRKPPNKRKSETLVQQPPSRKSKTTITQTQETLKNAIDTASLNLNLNADVIIYLS